LKFFEKNTKKSRKIEKNREKKKRATHGFFLILSKLTAILTSDRSIFASEKERLNSEIEDGSNFRSSKKRIPAEKAFKTAFFLRDIF
jgi:hypothetical protein